MFRRQCIKKIYVFGDSPNCLQVYFVNFCSSPSGRENSTAGERIVAEEDATKKNSMTEKLRVEGSRGALTLGVLFMTCGALLLLLS